jgi:hypothetical protein
MEMIDSNNSPRRVREQREPPAEQLPLRNIIVYIVVDVDVERTRALPRFVHPTMVSKLANRFPISV